MGIELVKRLVIRSLMYDFTRTHVKILLQIRHILKFKKIISVDIYVQNYIKNSKAEQITPGLVKFCNYVQDSAWSSKFSPVLPYTFKKSFLSTNISFKINIFKQNSLS